MKANEKKVYARPVLVKHGNVETLTQITSIGGGPSVPCMTYVN